jgi:predicted enzyme related to lactoylglutathione lyase
MGRPVVHWEPMSKDPAKVSEFYQKIFDWKIQHFPEMNLIPPSPPVSTTR